MAVNEEELIMPYLREDDEDNSMKAKAKKLFGRSKKEEKKEGEKKGEEKKDETELMSPTTGDKKKNDVSELQSARAELEKLMKEKPKDSKKKKEKIPAESTVQKAIDVLEKHRQDVQKKAAEEKPRLKAPELIASVKKRLEEPKAKEELKFPEAPLLEEEKPAPKPEIKPMPKILRPEPKPQPAEQQIPKSVPVIQPDLYEPEEEKKESVVEKARHLFSFGRGKGQPKKTIFGQPKTPEPSGPERVLNLEETQAEHGKKIALFEKEEQEQRVGMEEQKQWKERREAEVSEGPEFTLDLTPKLIQLPEMKDLKQINIRYPLIAPYAYAHIFWDDEAGELVYFVEEPALTANDRHLLSIIKKGIEEMLTVSYTKLSPGKLIQYIEDNVKSILEELAVPISKEAYLKIMYYVYRDFIGLNEIEPLLKDYYIEDIECNGVNYPIYIVHRKYENMRTNIMYQDVEKLGDFVEKLAQKTGRYVSYANPLLDGALPDGSRVNATYTKDITTRGPTFTIRKFTKEPWTAIHLIGYGTIAPEMMAYLWMAIQYKSNIMIIGETASGKTTFLNTIVHFIPPKARIVSIEDTRELNLAHSNWLPSVSRAGFGLPTLAGGERYGEVSLFDLLRETFRQNPDYVIVGEARGAEASVLFQGMASGHPSFSTFHAGSVETFVRRLETPPINLSPSLVEVLDIICICSHVKTREQNIRRVKAIEEVEKVEEDWSKSVINHRYVWLPSTDTFAAGKRNVIFEKISKNTGIPVEKLNIELKRRARLLEAMHKKNVFNFREVAKVLNDYYEEPDKVLRQFGVL